MQKNTQKVKSHRKMYFIPRRFSIYLILMAVELLIAKVILKYIQNCRVSWFLLDFGLKTLLLSMISDFNTNRKGNIDFSEWLYLMTFHITQKASRSSLKNIFNIFDDERTGYISFKNLKRMVI
jgi:hypothetical protein